MQAPMELDMKHIYHFDVTVNLPSGIIPLAVYHKIDHKHSELLNIPYSTPNTTQFTFQERPSCATYNQWM